MRIRTMWKLVTDREFRHEQKARKRWAQMQQNLEKPYSINEAGKSYAGTYGEHNGHYGHLFFEKGNYKHIVHGLTKTDIDLIIDSADPELMEKMLDRTETKITIKGRVTGWCMWKVQKIKGFFNRDAL